MACLNAQGMSTNWIGTHFSEYPIPLKNSKVSKIYCQSKMLEDSLLVCYKIFAFCFFFFYDLLGKQKCFGQGSGWLFYSLYTQTAQRPQIRLPTQTYLTSKGSATQLIPQIAFEATIQHPTYGTKATPCQLCQVFWPPGR